MFAAHRLDTARKVDHMTILDRKRQHGRLAALAALLQMPSSAFYILSETARAKLSSLLGNADTHGAVQQGGKARLLIGLSSAR
jgi:hypothetical protein